MFSPNTGATETNGIELDSIKLGNVIFLNNKVYVIPNPNLKNRCEREGGREGETERFCRETDRIDCKC